MIIAPASWNLLSSGTVLTSASAFQIGFPAANLWHADPAKPCVFRGAFTVVAGVNDKIDFNDGGAKTATLTPGTYYSQVEFGIMVAAAMNAASSNFYCFPDQSVANRNKFIIGRTSGSASYQVATGANASTNAMRLLMGWMSADVASAASSRAQLPAAHGSYATNTIEYGDQLIVDLGSAKSGAYAFVGGVRSSAGAVVMHGVSAAAGGAYAHYHLGDGPDDGVLFADLSSHITPYRYASLVVYDPRRTLAVRSSVCTWYYGPGFRTNQASFYDQTDVELDALSGTLATGGKTISGQYGHTFSSEVRPLRRITVGFADSPGVGPAEQPHFEQLVSGLGVGAYAYVCIDPSADYRQSETYLMRVVDSPTWVAKAVQSKQGRYGIGLTLEEVPFR